MRKYSNRLLRKLSKTGEVPLREAIRYCNPNPKGPDDLYPLALLIEAGYVGITFDYNPPNGAEEMREFALARTLFMDLLPRDNLGEAKYEGITISGAKFHETEKVFMKAKGFLYLVEVSARRNERIISFVLGIVSALLAIWVREYFFSNKN